MNAKFGTNAKHNPYKEFNIWVNDLFFYYSGLTNIAVLINEKFGEEYGYFVGCYMRDLVAGTAVYWITGFIWHISIYYILGNQLFSKENRDLPTSSIILDQMMLAQFSLFCYAALPLLAEFLIEYNYTKVYFYTEQVGGWGMYVAFLVLYITCVEIGIYWMHRTLHTNKFLYKYVHGLHHKYNKATTLTPWASLAFNPLDGILQASPYVICTLFIPVHYFTHLFLLFFSGIWATNIHDALWGDTEPIMGSKYHTVHHTHYHYNYGQFFIFCDWFWGTLKIPDREKFRNIRNDSNQNVNKVK